ncbi:MAG: cyclic nucleotide-binding domain-containing protein, partial [Pseudomonadota bacterium]
KEKLLEVDPMALNEIIKSNEIIEEEKSASIDQDYLNIWPELYKTLTREETNTLFYAMKSATYDANKSIFLQGESTSKLYFIYKGRLKMVFNQKDEEILIKELNPGDILGDDTFFYLTVCTTSAITLSRVELHFLEKGILTKWENEFSGIEPRLRDHCLGFEKIADLLKKRGLDRRSQKRVKISSKVSCQAIDASGSPIGQSIRGTLSDMSTGGLSFYLNIPKEKAAKMFLEPKLNIKFTLNEGESKKRIDQHGVVVAVLSHLYDYSIHFKFDKMLDEKMIERIKASENSGNGELELFTSS